MEGKKKLISVVTPCYNEEDNVTPCYATDGRIIFMSDKPYNGVHIGLDEYKGHPTVTGTYSLDPATGDLKTLQHATEILHSVFGHQPGS